MRLSDVSIRRPVLATVMSLGLILFGAIGLLRLPVRELPDVDPPIVNVTTVYPGASAGVIETQVTEPIEEVLTTIEGIKTLTSQSREQLSSVTVEFDLSRGIDIAAQDVRDRVARVRGRLPDDIDEPVVAKQDADAQPSMWIALYGGQYSTLELTTLAERLFQDRLQTVPGVSSILLGGRKRFAIRLWLEAEKMAAHGVTILDVQQALARQNIELPSGRVENWQRELSIQTQGELKTPEEYDQLVIRQDGATLLRLRDIGRAAVGVEDERAAARFNSQPAVGLGVVRQSKANTIDVARGIRAELERLKPLLPAGVQMSIPYDESVYIEHAINEVWITLAIAFLLVIATIFIFLQTLRSTLVPSITIPVSIIATFGALYLLGYSVNIVTMLSLVLAIGVVVDDAIIVLENIYRHVEDGMDPRDAAHAGMGEIAFAILATTVALVAVFLPLTFQTSLTGRLFIEFAVAISFAVVISAFVALTLTPMLAARVLRRHTGLAGNGFAAFFERGLGALTARYERGLRRVLRHPVLVVLMTLIVVAGSLVIYGRLEKEFLPEEDKGRLFCIFLAPEGSTSEYTDRMVRTAERILDETPDVKEYFSAVALARGGPGPANEGLAFVRLTDGPRRRVQDIVAGPTGLGRKFFREIAGALAIPIIPKAIGRGFGQTFQLVLQHQDLAALSAYSEQLSNRLRGAGYLMNVRSTFQLNKPELRVRVDRDRAASLGVSVEEIARTLQILFGGLDVSKLTLAGKEYDVIAQLSRESRLTPRDLERLYVRGASGRLVQLSSIVHSELGGGPSAIYHHNRWRAATVEGTPVGVPLGTVMARVEEILRQELPEGFRYEWTGEAKDLQAAGKETLFVLILAALIIYLVLAAQFESFVHPFTVMLTLPLGVLGALGSLWLMANVNRLGMMLYGWAHYAPDPPAVAGWLSAFVPRVPAMGINLFSQIGMVLLLGLVTKNGILLVDFANQQMARGANARDAMLVAARIRLRPILMTATSTVAGMLPIAIGFGAGAESRRPLGVAAIGGMVTSTFLTLFVIPVAYVLFDRVRTAWKRRGEAPTQRGPGAQALRRTAAALAAAALLMNVPTLGCALGPKYQRPPVDTPMAWKEPVPSGPWKVASPRDTEPRGAWWGMFRDPWLERLELRALGANQDLRAAAARVEQARALARLSAAELLPTLELNPSYDHFLRSGASFGGSSSFTGDVIAVPFDLSYEVDLWGRVRRSFEAATADAQARWAAYQSILLSLTAEVARQYFTLRALDTEHAIVHQTVALRQEALRLVQLRYEAGTASALDVARARTELAASEASLSDTERRRAEVEHALAVLCGAPASTFSIERGALDLAPPAIPAGVPSELLERRPDVAEAERLMASANARVGVATTAFFPVVRLTGSAGFSSPKLESLFDWNSHVWSLGPSVSVPLFTGGQGAANLRAARAEYEETVAAYRQRVLGAFRDVEDALAALRLRADQASAQARELVAVRDAAVLATTRYHEGIVDYLNVVDAERGRLEAELGAVRLLNERLIATVLLVKALGGAWDASIFPTGSR